MIYKNKFSFISGLYDICSRMTDNIPIVLNRCITNHKVMYAEYLLESLYPDARNTDALVEIGCNKNNKCTAHYIHIDENGNKSLKTQVYDGDIEDIIKRFGIVLLAISE